MEEQVRGWRSAGAWAGVVLCLCGTDAALAQQGDVRGEAQAPLPEDLVVPEAPVLEPAAALESFTLAPGFRIELVAAEPLVEDPVHMAFDAAGRLFVVEMRGFMPDAEGAGERAPVGRVVRLEDDDGDGRMDRSTVFADNLVLPRSVMPTHDGALVLAPPDLVYYRDADDDGVAERGTIVHTGFAGLESPEHAGNGLLPGLDNWIHLSQHPERLRFDGAAVVAERTPGHGQWGITRDDLGRLYYTTNSDPLRGDAWPLHYASRHPNLRKVVGVNERYAHDMRVWPARITPGVNRGYRKGTLRDDFTLAKFTAACGPLVYRGDSAPAGFADTALVCEPAGNLVKQYRLVEGEAWPRAELVAEGTELLVSTDERFRPVDLALGPEGAVYVADFYRGILQHRIFMTTFLRRQVDERGLATPLGRGRIWRIVADGMNPSGAALRMDRLSSAELVSMLAEPVAWRRETAQRLLVERGDAHVASAVRVLARQAPGAASRLIALWTLDGLGALKAGDAIGALGDRNAFVRATGVRLLEPYLDDAAITRALASLVDDEAAVVRVQLALSLGAGTSAETFDVLARMVKRHADDERIRSAVASGLAGRELVLLERLVSDPGWRSERPGSVAVLESMTQLVLAASDEERTQLLELALRMGVAWQRDAVLAAVARHMRLATARPRTLALAREPGGWTAFAQEPARDGDRRRAMDAHLAWPGRSEVVGGPRPLTEEEQTLFARGAALYLVTCASCHRADGRGARGTAPSLAGSERVQGDPSIPARIMMHGLTGPLESGGESWNLTMPPATVSSDGGIAAVLTYIRRAWGNDGDPVDAAFITSVRERFADRHGPWTAGELH